MTANPLLAAALTLALAGPVVAQTPPAAAATRARAVAARLVARNFQRRITRGVRTGAITPPELSALRTEIKTVRDRIRTIRQSGERPTTEERQEIRDQLRRIHRDIYTASHGNLEPAR